MSIMQEIKDKYGHRLKEQIKKLDNNWDYTPEQRQTVREFLSKLKNHTEEEIQEREIYVEVAEKFGNNNSSK